MSTAAVPGPRLRVAVLGTPVRPQVPWDADSVRRLADAGFTAVQLNIAWGYRPADEPLNLEDVVPWRGRQVPTGALPGEAAFARRRADLAERSRLAHAAGLRTILHVGAPYTGRSGYTGRPLPQCVGDPATRRRYTDLLRTLAVDFPDVDDVLLYTYDQDAWVCSEFGGCPRCLGRPLHERLPAFVSALAGAWSAARREGRLWWEPWELSAGQVLACVQRLDVAGTGLALHSTVAEVVSAVGPDLWFRSVARAAGQRGIPVLGEVFLSSASEETEPLLRYPSPLVTLRQVRAVEACPGVSGIKEYYGVTLDGGDANLDAVRAYLRDPAAGNDELVLRAAARYAPAAREVAAFWTASSQAFELYPWDACWFARQLGRSMPAHAMSAAVVRGMQSESDDWDTPSWRSSRAAVFVRTDNRPAHPWLLEDLQLRCSLAADAAEDAVLQARAALRVLAEHLPGAGQAESLQGELQAQVDDVLRFAVRVRAYALHLRATNLAAVLRTSLATTGQPAAHLLAEMRELLLEDLANQRRLPATSPAGAAPPFPPDADPSTRWLAAQGWIVPETAWRDEVTPALELLGDDPVAFLETYFTEAKDVASRGQFSFTSR